MDFGLLEEAELAFQALALAIKMQITHLRQGPRVKDALLLQWLNKKMECIEEKVNYLRKFQIDTEECYKKNV